METFDTMSVYLNTRKLSMYVLEEIRQDIIYEKFKQCDGKRDIP